MLDKQIALVDKSGQFEKEEDEKLIPFFKAFIERSRFKCQSSNYQCCIVFTFSLKLVAIIMGKVN